MFGSRAPPIRSLVVHFDKKEYKLTFTPEDYNSNGEVTVGLLRHRLAELFKVPLGQLSLYQVKPRRKISNDKATLSDYSLSDGSHVLAVFKAPGANTPESTPTPSATPQGSTPSATPAPAKPLTPREQVDAALGAVETDLGPRIKAFCASPPPDEKSREKEYRILTEVILQNIIKLDNVEVDGDPDLRAARKGAINTMHSYHAEIDKANNLPFGNNEAAGKAGDAGKAGQTGKTATNQTNQSSQGNQSGQPQEGQGKRKNKRKNKKR